MTAACCHMIGWLTPPVTWRGQPEDRWIPLAFGSAKDFVPAILIMGHFSDFWTKSPGRGTKYLSPPHLFPSYSLCLALPFKVYLDSVPSWKHPTTPPCPADLVSPSFVSRSCSRPHHLLLQSLYFLICFLQGSGLLEGQYWDLLWCI